MESNTFNVINDISNNPFTVTVELKHKNIDYINSVVPQFKVYTLDSNGCILADSENFSKVFDSTTSLCTISENINDLVENEYTLVVERMHQSSEDRSSSIEITGLKICGVDLNDLIYRRGHTYLDCTNDLDYIAEHSNNEKFLVDTLPHESNYTHKTNQLFYLRHNGVKGNSPFSINSITGEKTIYDGAFVTYDSNYIIKEDKLYYNATKDLNFIAENCNNEDLYLEGDLFLGKLFEYTHLKTNLKNDSILKNINNIVKNKHDVLKLSDNLKLIHHVPNSACLNMNGRWEFKFKTPLYGWVVDNIFGNDFA